MKSTLLISMPVLSVLAALAMPVRLDAQEQSATAEQNPVPQSYTVKDLGVLGTGTNGAGFGINNPGWVAGSRAERKDPLTAACRGSEPKGDWI